jgi:hypothetical protein
MGIEAILSLAGLIVPPAFHFIKGLFLPDKADDPESTMSTLAINKPEVLGPYTEALAKYTEAQVKYFNRDVAGTPAQWVINLRAVIRPASAAVGVVALVAEGTASLGIKLDPGTRAFFCLAVSSWFGGKVFNGS